MKKSNLLNFFYKKCITSTQPSVLGGGTVIIFLALSSVPMAQATSIYWDGTGTSWNINTNWSTAAGATTPDPGAVPGASDTAIFNITTVNTAQAITLDAAQAALGLQFNSTGTTSLSTGTGTNALTLGTGGITVASTAGAVTINNNVVMGGAQTWSLLNVGGTGSLTVNGKLTGSGGLSYTSSNLGNTLILAGDNSGWSGSLTLNSNPSTIVLANNNALGTNNSAINTSGTGKVIGLQGNITLQATSFTFSGSADPSLVNISGNNTVQGTIFLQSGGGNTIIRSDAGNLNIASAVSAISGGRYLVLQGVSNGTVTGNIDGTTNTPGLSKRQAGTWTLSGTNTFTTGKTSVYGGTLQFAKQVSLYNNVTTNWTATNINVGSGATLAFNVGGTGEFTTGNVTTLLGNLAASTATLTESAATGGTSGTNTGGNGMNAGSSLGFDTTNASGGSFTIADAINNTTGATGGSRGVTKLGTGELVLSSNSSNYSGATTVAAGKLTINGNISTSITSVNSGGTLGGTGTVGAVTVASGGTMAAGTSAATTGILAAGNTNLQTGSTFLAVINGATVGTQYSQLNVTGTVTLAGALAVTIGAVPVTGTMFFIVKNDGSDAVTGTFSNAATSGNTYTINGQKYIVSYTGDDITNSMTGGNDVVIQAVPEPASLLLGGLGLLTLLRRRRNS